MTELTDLLDEATEITKNAYSAYQEGEITHEQYIEVRNNTLLDIGYQTEIVSQEQ